MANSLLQDALDYMNTLITEGIEYPDAQYQTAVKFKVDYVALANAYDRQG